MMLFPNEVLATQTVFESSSNTKPFHYSYDDAFYAFCAVTLINNQTNFFDLESAKERLANPVHALIRDS